MRDCLRITLHASSLLREALTWRLLEDREWIHTVSNVKGFIHTVVHEFYANLFEIVNVAESLEFEKVYVHGHIYEFSPKEICEYLKIPMYSFNDFDRTYIMDGVASELLRIKSTWLENNSLRASKITFKYYGVHKIAMNNWSLTTHYTTISRDMSTLVFDIGSYLQVNLGQLIFSNIVD